MELEKSPLCLTPSCQRAAPLNICLKFHRYYSTLEHSHNILLCMCFEFCL